jgi:general secretion pathway protein I
MSEGGARVGPRRRSRRPGPAAGFTLIEALVALAVFMIVAVVFSQAFLNTLMALEQHAAQSAHVDALRFVRSQVILEPDLDTFEEGGEIETLDLGEAIWQAEVEPTEVPHLFRVALRIEFSGSDTIEGWTHEETLLLLRPTWSDPTEVDERMLELQESIEKNRQTWDW